MEMVESVDDLKSSRSIRGFSLQEKGQSGGTASSGAHDTVLDYADLFTITLRNDDVQAFDTRWDEIPFSMTKIPLDDVLEGVYKLRIRVSDQLKTVFYL